MHDPPQPELRLRLLKGVLVTGIVCSIEFALIGSVSVYAAAFNIGGSFPNPLEMAIFFGLFWGAFFALSLWVIAAALREELTVTADALTQREVTRTRTIRWEDVEQLTWRSWPRGGSVVIRGNDAVFKIYLSNFLRDEQAELVARLRTKIPEQKQQGWQSFHENKHQKPLSPREARNLAIFSMLLFLITGAMFAYWWTCWGATTMLVAAIVCVVAACWYLVRILRFVPPPDPDSIDSSGRAA